MVANSGKGGQIGQVAKVPLPHNSYLCVSICIIIIIIIIIILSFLIYCLHYNYSVDHGSDGLDAFLFWLYLYK